MTASLRELDEAFHHAYKPVNTTLVGTLGRSEWTVTMLTGIIPDLSSCPTHHRKQLWLGSDRKVYGRNVCFKNMRWGHFSVSTAIWEEDGREALLLDYSQSGLNGLMTRRIRDVVRMTSNQNVMLGRFNYEIVNKQRFVGYFKMSRTGV
jgi:hypothetical protein